MFDQFVQQLKELAERVDKEPWALGCTLTGKVETNTAGGVEACVFVWRGGEIVASCFGRSGGAIPFAEIGMEGIVAVLAASYQRRIGDLRAQLADAENPAAAEAVKP